MKKVFWTSFVWIILVLWFTFYIKLFNTPLAERVANFIYRENIKCPICEECNISDEMPTTWNVDCPEIEPTACYCPDQTVFTWVNDENWTILFKQLDRIEKTINSANIEENEDDDLSAEYAELSDELKERIKKNNK